jgi:sugar (pentulose or hexulose) kinase
VHILAIDQGTSATKALLVGPGQQVLGSGEVPVRVRAVGTDGVEADPEELYQSVIEAGTQALAAARAPAHAVALANQGDQRRGHRDRGGRGGAPRHRLPGTAARGAAGPR